MRQFINVSFLACLVLLFVSQKVLASPVNGDYRSSHLSNVTVSLSSASNWYQFEGITNTWVVALTAPGTGAASGNTITISSGDTWTNSAAVTLPAGVTLIHEGSNGSFSTSNKITLNGIYIHRTSAPVDTILNGMIIGSSSTFEYDGVTGSFAGKTYGNLVIGSASGTYSLSGASGTLTVLGTLSVDPSVTLTIPQDWVVSVGGLAIGNSGSVTINGIVNFGTGQATGAGSITVNGTVKTAHASGLGGTLANTGTKTLGTSSTIEFTGGDGQTVDGPSDFANVIISGGGTKNLGGPCTVIGGLLLSGTSLNLGSNNLILTTGNVTGASASAYIKTNGTGVLQLNNITSSPRLFPVGRSTYNPVTISNGSGLNWTVNLKDETPTSLGLILSPKGIDRTWDITPIGTPTGATLVFQYDDGDVQQKGINFSTSSKVQVLNYHGSEWIPALTGATPSGSANGIRTVTVSNWSTFSPFVITNSEEVLPVRFKNVKAEVKGRKVQYHFTNETESDVVAYQLERSPDGGSFTSIATIKPAKNNGNTATYTYTDAGPLQGQNIYRIKALQVSGKAEYSNIVRANIEVKALQLQVVPNPVTGQKLVLRAEELAPGLYQVLIVNAGGQLVKQTSFTHVGSLLGKEIDVYGLSKGAYILKLVNNSFTRDQRFVVQ